jgi:hypothetical protein
MCPRPRATYSICVYSHGRSVAAIARETGKSAGAVKVGLMRTRRILGALALGA